jgi:hypothetical protein
MKLATDLYVQQAKRWPPAGRHILAHHDAQSIIVYQAYRPSIGRFTVEHGYFGGGFSLTRMSWIKPNFLWMMYRCGWGTKEGQAIILGLRLRRAFFDSILAQAVQSSYYEGHFPSREQWREALASSAVRLQWDPDHDPSGAKLERRAIQLGLRAEVLKAFSRRELLEVIDMTEFVAEQRPQAASLEFAGLRTPVESVYVPSDPTVGKWLGLGSTRAEPAATADGGRDANFSNNWCQINLSH